MTTMLRSLPAAAMAAGRHARPAARLAWVDHARGIAVTLVVWGHCARGLMEAGIVPPGSVLQWVDGVIYSFHNPLFFFLSGIFSGHRAGTGPRAAWRGRLAAIAWAYVLWMSIALALMTGLSGLTNAGPPDVGPATYLYQPISPFWFLYALIAATLFTRALGRLGPAAMLAVAAIVYVAGEAAGGGILPSVGWGLFYVCLGASCSDFVRRPGFIQAVRRPAMLLLLAAGTVASSVVLIRLGWGNQLMVPAALMGTAFVFGIASRLSSATAHVPALRIVGVLGRISLTVLVVHVLGTAGTRIVLLKVLDVHAEWLHLLAGTTAGLALPLALQWAASRTGLSRLAGLPRT